ncbi:MAG TPA: XdhC family protein [Bacteroidia bacterium]|nr:XdhC family protein [Bacteroidia bacterium]
MNSLYRKILEIENSNEKAALCTIIGTQGSAPRKTGAKMLVGVKGRIEGTIGGGSLEKAVISQALEVLESNTPVRVKHNLVADLAMCCGGSVELFIEPVMNKKKLYIFGAGHIGKALAGFALDLDFKVTLIDERYEAFEGQEGALYTLKQEQHTSAIEQLEFDTQTLIVILTHNHAYDREILALTSKKPHLYIGMIGSERKVLIARKNLVSSGILNEEEMDGIDMPIGIEMKAVTPQEIAISILAKLIDVRNWKK